MEKRWVAGMEEHHGFMELTFRFTSLRMDELPENTVEMSPKKYFHNTAIDDVVKRGRSYLALRNTDIDYHEARPEYERLLKVKNSSR